MIKQYIFLHAIKKRIKGNNKTYTLGKRYKFSELHIFRIHVSTERTEMALLLKILKNKKKNAILLEYISRHSEIWRSRFQFRSAE